SNFAGLGVLDTSRTFHAASPALVKPGLRPTRGSGRGAAVDMAAVGAGAVAGLAEGAGLGAGDCAVWVDLAHAATSASDSTNDIAGDLIFTSRWGAILLRRRYLTGTAGQYARGAGFVSLARVGQVADGRRELLHLRPVTG